MIRRSLRFVSWYWKRHVRERPDWYRAHVTLPTSSIPGEGIVGAAADVVSDLEELCEGRLDVSGVEGFRVQTDPLPADEFDAELFSGIVGRIREVYPEPFVVRETASWRTRNGQPGIVYLVSPVKPLFPSLAGSTGP